MDLESLRQIIDELNAEIIELFSERLKIAKEIAKIKKEHNLPVHDPAREEKQLRLLRELAKSHGLSPAIIEEIFTFFVDYSKLKMKIQMAEDEKSRLPRN
jgi:monofunctional chorismate mutase